MGFYDGAETLADTSPATMAKLMDKFARQDAAWESLQGGAYAIVQGRQVPITPQTHDDPIDGKWGLKEDGIELNYHPAWKGYQFSFLPVWSFFAVEEIGGSLYSQQNHFYQIRIPGKPLEHRFYSMQEVKAQFQAMSAEEMQAFLSLHGK